jgi:hypothetical protein
MQQQPERIEEDTSSSRLAEYLLEVGLQGAGPLSGAAELAEEYLADTRYRSNDQRVNALIRREIAKNFTTGFVTGLGGVVTFPVSIPAALGASWILQARMAGAIARIYGYELGDPRVRTQVLLSLAGDVARDAMRDMGFNLHGKLTQRALEQVPGRALVEINKRIGARLLAKATGKVILRFPRAVPVVGGVVGGAMDAIVCRMVGRTAKTLFRRASPVIVEGEVLDSQGRGGPRP